MNTFLEFLNNAEPGELISTPGVGPALAGRIVAARPFASVEDSQRVSGLGEKLLQRLQNSFEGSTSMSEETALSPTQPEPETEEKSRPEAAPISRPKQKSNFGQRLGSAFGKLVRFVAVLLVIALILGGIGAGLYFGLPYLHAAYVVPVNQNTTRIAAVAHQQARDTLALNTEIAALRNEIRLLQNDIADLQTQKESLASQLAAAETAIESHNTTLARLEEMQTKLDASANQERESLNGQLSMQLQRTRAIELLSRARLYLSQSNFGQARQDVVLARDLLTELREQTSEAEREPLDAALFRLDLTLENLPGFPVVAADDLNIAWNLLVLGAPEPVPAETETP